MNKLWGVLRFGSSAVAYLYATAVFSWFILHLLFNDQWGWLFLLNTGAIYLVLWVPLWGIRPLLTKSRTDILLYIGLIAILLVRFGSLLMPTFASAESPTELKVMTTNLLGSNVNLNGIEEALLNSEADVVGIQELNPRMAIMIREDLSEAYPYQILDPQVGTTGMGVISRYPIELQPMTFGDLFWVGTPQIVRLFVGDTAVDIVNFHAIPPVGAPLPDPRAIRIREAQARFLAEFSQSNPNPVILLGDLNATDQSEAHAILTDTLQDSWHAGGNGLGNTWPGFRPTKAGRLILPSWLVRIDHVFVSSDLQVIRSEIGPWDGGADHRPVMATIGVPSSPPAASN
ncbi:MAG: endonuclease/exonuclease/phosphatase family protein [Chloroflexota bacterium]